MNIAGGRVAQVRNVVDVASHRCDGEATILSDPRFFEGS